MLAHNLLVGRAIVGNRLRLFNRRLSTLRPERAAAIEHRLDTRAVEARQA